MAYIPMTPMGGVDTLYKASSSNYVETINLSKSYKSYKWIVIDWNLGNIHSSTMYYCKDLNINDYIGDSITTGGYYMTYGQVISTTQIKLSAHNGANTCLYSVYGIE